MKTKIAQLDKWKMDIGLTKLSASQVQSNLVTKTHRLQRIAPWQTEKVSPSSLHRMTDDQPLNHQPLNHQPPNDQRLNRLAINFIAIVLIAAMAFIATSAAQAANGADNFFAVGELFDLGNKVWFDANGNAQFDAGEQGVPGVQLTLLDDFGNPYDTDPTLAGVQDYSTTTDANGSYLFTSLITDTYRISVDAINFQSGGALEGYAAVDLASGSPDDNIDSDSNGIQVGELDINGLLSGSITLNIINNPTFINNTVDFGFYTLTLGDRVWEDLNNDGLYDPQRESGIPDVTVNLLDDSGSLVNTTLTDGSGLYTFTSVISGNYIVEVIPPSGYFSSTGDGEEENPNENGDENDNGTNLLVSDAIQSAPFEFVSGNVGNSTNNTIVNQTGATINPTIDFGL